MKKRYFVLGFAFILAYNWFLIQRDNQLFEAYNRPNYHEVQK